jgi:hypothetical protein
MAKNPKKKIGALTILGWVFGLLLMIVGVGALTMNFGLSIIYFLSGLIIFPPGYRLVSDTFNIQLSVIARIVIALLILFGVGLIFVLMYYGFSS